MNLEVKIGKSKFKNPVTVASGTFGHAEKYFDLEEVKELGAITPKTVTPQAQEGNSPVRIVETNSGMLNAIGIENPGADGFIETKLPSFQSIGVPLIISVIGYSTDQFEEIVTKFQGRKNVKALELNLSCPNLKKKSLIAQDAKATFETVKAAKKVSKLPILAKLSPDVTNITDIAKAAEDAGADGISMVNTFTAMVIDVEKRRSKIGNFTGGLSGPAIRPIAVRMVHQTYNRVKIPIIAMGGIAKPQDALEYIIAGATMVAVGTYNFVNPRAPLDVLNGIKDYMKRHKMDNLKQLRGSLTHE